MRYGAVILAGGKSRRMGKNKAQLQIDGVCYLDKLADQLSGFQELLISVDDKAKHPEITYPMVNDLFEDAGPLAGLYSALTVCVSDALVVVPCDVPLFSGIMAQEMCAVLKEGEDAVIAVTDDGRVHPLCGVYKKTCMEQMKQCLDQHNYRVKDLLSNLRVRWYQAGENSWQLKNINTPEDEEDVGKKAEK